MFGAPQKDRQADARVRSVLEELGVKYAVDDDFDFRVLFEVEDGRTQSAIVRSQTEQFMGIEIREILSAGLASQGPFDARTAKNFTTQTTQ